MAMPTLALILGSWASLFWFMTTHSTDINRSRKPAGVDWTDGSAFTALLIPYIFLAFSCALSIAYLQWICSSFSNQPYVLGRINGFIEGMRALGLVTAFGIDSNKVAFMTEGSTYFSLQVLGTICGVASLLKFATDTDYGHEDSVIPPLTFEGESPVLEPHASTTASQAETFDTKV